MRLVLAVFAVFVTLMAASRASAFDVTICHQTVPVGEDAFLLNDLFCGNNGGPNITLGGGSTLKLNGHRIDGGYLGIATHPGAPVKIFGPGEITGAESDPFGAAIGPAGKVYIDTVWLHGNRRGILSIYDFPMRLSNVLITNNAVEGISSLFSYTGPGKGTITGRNVTIAVNGGDGIVSLGTLTLRDSAINENGGAGIRSRGKRFALQDVAVTNNVDGGILSESPKISKLKRSVATGNGPEGDIAAPVAPKLVSSTCEHSVDTDSGGTLGICTGD